MRTSVREAVSPCLRTFREGGGVIAPPAVVPCVLSMTDEGVRPPMTDEGVRPPMTDEGVRPPMTDEGVRPPMTDEGVRPPGVVDIRAVLLCEPVPVYVRGGRLPEERVVSLWLDAVAHPRSFAGTHGESVHVVHPGTRNRFEGPDFLDACVIVDGVERRGDVEVHTREEDWFAHGHHRDERYRNVVLHVVLYARRDASSAGGLCMPTVELCAQLATSLREVWRTVPAATGRPACAPRAHLVPARVAAAAVHLAAEQRFEQKVRRAIARLRDLMQLLDPEAASRQLLYEHLLRALGYGGNEDAARDLARAVPLARLAAVQTDAVEMHADVPAALSSIHPARLEARVAQLEARAARLLWHRAGVRPGNAMHARLAWLALIAPRLADPVWHERLQRAVVRDAHAGRCDEVPSFFETPPEHRALHPGPERLAEILTNAVAPVVAALARTRGDASLDSAAHRIFSDRRPAPANAITRRMAPVLGLGRSITTGEQQGMLGLWHSRCAQAGCDACLIGAWLLRQEACV